MSDAQRQELYRFILVGLRAAGEKGRSARQLVQDVRAELGREISEDQLASELRLMDDRLKLVAPLTISLIGVRWILTTRGEQALAEAGL